jgi:heme/copper-type cytochrome/quinol oxidase subunit 3
MEGPLTHSRRETASGFAVRFFHTAALLYAAVVLLTWLLTRLLPAPVPGPTLRLPWAFLVSTALLLATSILQERALAAVRLERQRPFRRRLLAALGTGCLFIVFQGYGLWWLLRSQERTAAAASTGAAVFAFALAFLHAMHVSVAALFLVYVVLKSHVDRYDHEYHWGVVACAWLWHGLGIVWLAILAVFVIAS